MTLPLLTITHPGVQALAVFKGAWHCAFVQFPIYRYPYGDAIGVSVIIKMGAILSGVTNSTLERVHTASQLTTAIPGQETLLTEYALPRYYQLHLN